MHASSETAQLDLLAADVPDPTDFPPSDVAPGLRLLDEALRCSICHELYDAPVALNCGHSFCSLCARSCLRDKEECPSCRKPASDMHLRKNVALESAVKAWATARDFTLRLAKQEARHLVGNATEDPARPKKRRRHVSLSGSSSSDEVEIVDGPSTLTSRRPAPNNKRPRSKKSPLTPDTLATPSAPSTPGSSDGLVDCPMCQKRVPLQMINQHIDSSCRLTAPPSPHRPKGKAKQEWSKILGGAPRRATTDKVKDGDRVTSPDDEPDYLPTVSYHTLKDKRVQELLHEHGLPTTGDRTVWVRRHQRWVTLYNANLDRATADRRTADQLRRELRKWEATEGGTAASGTVGKKKTGEVKDVVAYQTAHRAEFAKLVEAARPKRSLEATANEVAKESKRSHARGSQESDGDNSPQLVSSPPVIS